MVNHTFPIGLCLALLHSSGSAHSMPDLKHHSAVCFVFFFFSPQGLYVFILRFSRGFYHRLIYVSNVLQAISHVMVTYQYDITCYPMGDLAACSKWA